MNKHLVVFSFCISFSISGMEEIKQAMQKCDLNQVKHRLSADQLKNNPDKLVDTALNTECPIKLLQFMHTLWSTNNPPHTTLAHAYGTRKPSTNYLPAFVGALQRNPEIFEWYLSHKHVK